MTKQTRHPLEDVFNIESGSLEPTQYDIVEQPQQTAAAPAPKDEDDRQIDARLDTIYDAAVLAYENQSAYAEIIDPKFAARNAEVAANYLTIALAAVNSKAKAKADRRKSVAPSAGGSTTNNILVANREDILKMINIDGDKKELK